MSMEMNKALVEQAGGDERAAFELFVRKHCGMPEHIAVNWDAKFTNDAWEGWQARAALAQPSPVSEALIYACKNLAQITSSDGSGHADIALAVLRMAGVGDDERERLVNEWKAARAWKPSPAQAEGTPVVGCLCGMPMTEGHHSPDGCCNLEEFAPNPAQSQAEGFTHFPELLESVQQMDAMLKANSAQPEQPEVVGYLLAKGNGTLSILRAGSSDEPVMTVAQHERIIGELRAVIAQLRQHKNDYMDSGQETYRALQNEIREREAEIARLDGLVSGRMAERDAALARVAELEKLSRAHDPLRIGLAAMIGTFKTASNPGEESTLRMANQLFDATADARYGDFKNKAIVDRLIAGLAAPVAQTQHSVPEGFREKFKQCMELAFAEIAYYVSPEKARDPNSRARKAGALATELHAMLAAAPGKEGL